MRLPPASCSPLRPGRDGRARRSVHARGIRHRGGPFPDPGGKYGEALAILRPLARGREVDGSVLFQIGLAATGASQHPDTPEAERDALLDEAIASFRAMLIDRPGLVRVRLELARVFFLKGEDGLSRRHFERVLVGKPPPPVAANVRRFLSEIRARRRWTLDGASG